MISMLKILSIKAPDPNAFSQSDIDFHIEGEHVYFDKLDFKGDAISLLGKGEMNFQGDTRHGVGGDRRPCRRRPAGAAQLFYGSESTIHADPRQRQLAESRHPPGSLARREPGLEEPCRRTDEHWTSFQHRRQRGGNFPGPDPGFRNRPCPAGEHRAGTSCPAASRRPRWPPASARPTATTTRPPNATPTAGVCGSFPSGKTSRTPARRRTPGPQGQDPTGQSGSMLDLSG